MQVIMRYEFKNASEDWKVPQEYYLFKVKMTVADEKLRKKKYFWIPELDTRILDQKILVLVENPRPICVWLIHVQVYKEQLAFTVVNPLFYD